MVQNGNKTLTIKRGNTATDEHNILIEMRVIINPFVLIQNHANFMNQQLLLR